MSFIATFWKASPAELKMAIRNINPKTKRRVIFWLVLVGLCIAVNVVTDGFGFGPLMLGLTVLAMAACEIGYDAYRNLQQRQQEEGEEESFVVSLLKEPWPGLSGRSNPAISEGTPEAVPGAGDAAAAAGEALADAVADAAGEIAGEVVSEVAGDILSGL